MSIVTQPEEISVTRSRRSYTLRERSLLILAIALVITGYLSYEHFAGNSVQCVGGNCCVQLRCSQQQHLFQIHGHLRRLSGLRRRSGHDRRAGARTAYRSAPQLRRNHRLWDRAARLAVSRLSDLCVVHSFAAPLHLVPVRTHDHDSAADHFQHPGLSGIVQR